MKSLVAQFDECYSPEWCKAILKAYQEVSHQSKNHCRSLLFGEKEGKDLLSHYSRARFETEVRRITKLILPESTSESRPNSIHSYFHTFVEAKNLSGGAVVLTASAVKDKMKPPRPSKFRFDYNNNNGQLELLNQHALLEDTPIYGLIFYSHPSPNTAPFLEIVFPSPDSGKIIDRIDLIARHPGIVNMPELDREEIIPQPVSPEVEKLAPIEEIRKANQPGIRRRKKVSGE